MKNSNYFLTMAAIGGVILLLGIVSVITWHQVLLGLSTLALTVVLTQLVRKFYW